MVTHLSLVVDGDFGLAAIGLDHVGLPIRFSHCRHIVIRLLVQILDLVEGARWCKRNL